MGKIDIIDLCVTIIYNSSVITLYTTEYHYFMDENP